MIDLHLQPSPSQTNIAWLRLLPCSTATKVNAVSGIDGAAGITFQGQDVRKLDMLRASAFLLDLVATSVVRFQESSSAPRMLGL